MMAFEAFVRSGRRPSVSCPALSRLLAAVSLHIQASSFARRIQFTMALRVFVHVESEDWNSHECIRAFFVGSHVLLLDLRSICVMELKAFIQGFHPISMQWGSL